MTNACRLPPLRQPDLFSNCQRWRRGRESYRPAGEPFDPSRCEVQPIPFGEARDFVCGHHYAGSMPAALEQLGLWHKPNAFSAEQLAGVIVLSVPMQERVIPAYFTGLNPREGAEIGRLVLLDFMPGNSETWFLGRAFRHLRRTMPQQRGILSYSDPVERVDEHGVVRKRGHIGTVYRAFNGQFVGRSSPRTLTLSRDARCISERALSKIRNDESGAGYAVRQLMDMGAPPRRPLEDGRSYVQRALREGGFRRMRHPGNLAFAWWLGDKRQNPLDSP